MAKYLDEHPHSVRRIQGEMKGMSMLGPGREKAVPSLDLASNPNYGNNLSPGVLLNVAPQEPDYTTAASSTTVPEDTLAHWIAGIGGSVSQRAIFFAHAIHDDGGDNILALRSLQLSDLRALGLRGIEARAVLATIKHKVEPPLPVTEAGFLGSFFASVTSFFSSPLSPDL